MTTTPGPDDAEGTSVLGVVGETLLTPLYARANAERLLPGIGLRDPLAAELLERVGHDPARVLTDRSNMAGALHRALVLDDVTTRFAAAHPDAQVVSAGVGLCTRHARLADRVPATVSWIGIDTPDVVELRRRLLPDDPVRLVAADLTEPGWAATVDADRPTVVLAEGVLMYVDPPGLAAFLTEVRDRLGPGTEVAGDYFHPKVAASDRHPIVRATGARFLSGARNGAALAATVSGYRSLADLPVMERISVAQRAAANAFRLVTRGSRLYAVAHLVVTGRGTPDDGTTGDGAGAGSG